MSSPKQDRPASNARPASFASPQSGSTHSKSSSTSRFESVTKIFRSSSKKEDRSLIKGLAAVQHGPLGIFVPKDDQGGTNPSSPEDSSNVSSTPSPAVSQLSITPTAADSDGTLLSTVPVSISQSSTTLVAHETMTTVLSDSTLANQQPWLTIFPQNVAAPMLSTALPPSGTRFETTAQLAHCNNLLRKHLSPSAASETHILSLNAPQQAAIEPFVQDEEEQNRVLCLTQKVVEEFAVNTLKTSALISEVVLLAPSLNEEYYRKLLNCLIS
ncbi:hypothetical protein BGX33_010681, partial [Mortierella sp. NVP41]